MFGQSLLSAFGSAACTTDTDQLFTTDVQTTSIATYQFNGNSTSIPNNTYPGSDTNISYVTGKFGQAAQAGTSSRINTGYIQNGQVFSVSFWGKGAFGTGGSVFRDTPSGGGSNTFMDIATNSYGQPIFGGNAGLSPPGATPSAGWTHYVFCLDGTNSKIYVNSVEVATGTYTAKTGNNGTPVCIFANGLYPAGFASGIIDQARIFSTALPQAAVTALYNETTTTATYDYVKYESANPNSVAYYKMSDATDQLGNYNGTASNVNFNTEGKFGFAGYFNGSDSYVSLPAGINKNNNFSWSFWINFTSMTQYDTPIGFFMNGCTNFIDMLSVGRLSLYDGNSRLTTPNSTFATGNWYHVVLTKSSTAGRKFYVNGLEVASDSVNTNSGGTTGGRNLFGAYSSGGNPTTAAFALDGKMDQVRIYDSAISAANVTTLYEEIECPAVAVTNAFNTVLYTGNGSTQSITNVGFEPNLTWIKPRSQADNHNLFDTIRGVQKQLISNNTSAESTQPNTLTSFNSNGFSIGPDNNINTSAQTYVGWNWKAGGAAVSNTDGTITSQVSANVDAGFSIVSYTGNLQAGASIGHSLGVKPDLIITKSTSNAESWEVWSSALNNGGVGQQLRLNSSNAAFSATDYYSTPDTSKFYVGGFTGTNGNGYTYVSYCFHSVAGYSKVGSYVGTGAAGNVQYIGFEPSFIMAKAYTNSEDWFIIDNKRGDTKYLKPNTSTAEATAGAGINFLSNGFEFTGGSFNNSGMSFIYLAIA